MTDLFREFTLSTMELGFTFCSWLGTLAKWAIVSVFWGIAATLAVAVLYFAWPIVGLALFYFVFFPLIKKSFN